jgi:tRNA(Ile)-lysidine synthase
VAAATAGRLWIAYSGGLDSHVLLHAVANLRGRLGADLRAVHVHHGLQAAADDWVRHCAEVCRGLGVPLDVRHVAVSPASGESLEAVARDVRYAVFRDLLAAGNCLATAQHRDDQAETLLLALLRGAGVHGLAAMPTTAPLGAGRLLRPLLDLPRAALVEYACAHGLRWIEDPSNTDLNRDRNRLRVLVMPRLRRRWPAMDRTLARSAAHCAEAAALLDDFADELLAGLAAEGGLALTIAGLRALEAPRRRLVLRRWLARRGFPPPDVERLRRISDELLPAAPDRQPLVAWPGCEVRRHRDRLYALQPLPPAPETSPRVVHGSAVQLPPPLGELSWEQPGGEGQCLHLAFAAAGLGCERPGRPAATLKTLFQTAGVPAWLRPFVPLLLLDGQLAGVGGTALCGLGLSRLAWTGHPWMAFPWFKPELPGA